MEFIQEVMGEWYLLLSQVSATLSVPLKQVADWAQLPLFTALLFGLIGAVSPCQLTTNLSAMAYVSRRLGEGQPWWEALAYTLGKMVVYMFTGSAAIFLGLKLEQTAIPVVIVARKIIGPLMILIGLGLLGVIRLRGAVGGRLASWVESHMPQGGLRGAFGLGVVFSFTFCPTLFWLFFGLTIPLALTTSGGWTFPGVFAIGTTLPLLAFAGLLASGFPMSGVMLKQLKQYHRRVSQVSGAVFILVGISDTLTYWFI